MKKAACAVLALVLVLGLTGCGEKKETPQNKEGGLAAGDVFEVKDDGGNTVFTISVESAKNVPDYEYKEYFEDYVQIIELTYTYENIAGGDKDVCVWPDVLIVSDENGSVGYADSMFPKGKPVDTPQGSNNTVNAYYGLKNESKEITVRYKSESFPKCQATYKLFVE